MDPSQAPRDQGARQSVTDCSRHRLRSSRCSDQLTKKLTRAPRPASTAVFSRSCTSRLPKALNSVPPPVAKPSCALLVRMACSFRLRCRICINSLQHTEYQRHTFRCVKHLWRQFYRSSQNQLTGQRQCVPNPLIYSRPIGSRHSVQIFVFIHVSSFVFLLIKFIPVRIILVVRDWLSMAAKPALEILAKRRRSR